MMIPCGFSWKGKCNNGKVFHICDISVKDGAEHPLQPHVCYDCKKRKRT